MKIYLVFSSFWKPKYEKPITISMFLGALGSPPALPKPGLPGPRPWPSNFQAQPCHSKLGRPGAWAGLGLEIAGPGPGSRQPWLGEGGGDLKAPKNIEIVMGFSYFGFNNNEKTK